MKIFNSVRTWLSKHDWVRKAILCTIVAVSFGFSIVALIIANSDVRDGCEMEYFQSKATELAGLIFTVIGAVFALYFVILGIDASKKKDEMRQYVDELKAELIGMENDRKRIELNNLDTMYSHMIQISETIEDKKKRQRIMNLLRRSRARLAVQSNILSLNIRKQRIPDLAVIGEQSDIEDLKKLLKNPEEDETIKDMAIGIILLIEERLKRENP